MKTAWILTLGILLAPPIRAQQEAAPIDTHAARIAAAHASLRLGEPIEALRWLDAVPPAARAGWEWRWLAAQLDQTAALWPAAAAAVTSMAISRDGEVVAIGLASGGVELRRAKDGSLLRRQAAHTAAVRSVAFSPEGTLLASGGEDRHLRVSKVSSGESVLDWESPDFSVRGVAFSPDGKRIALSTFVRDREHPPGLGVVKILDLETGAEAAVLLGTAHPVNQILYSADGREIWGASWDRAVFSWSLETGQRTRTLGDHAQHVQGVDISPAAGRVVSGGDDQRVNLRSLADGSLIRSIDDHGGDVTAVAFSPDGTLAASASEDGSIQLWRSVDGSAVTSLTGHREAVGAFVFLPAGDRLVSGGADGSIRVFSVSSEPPPHGGRKICEAAYSAAFSPDDEQLGVVCYDGSVNILSPRDGTVQTTVPDSESRNAADWLPDGATLVAGTNDGRVEAFGQGSSYGATLHDGAVIAISALADGRILSASYDRTAKISQDGKILAVLKGATAALNDARARPDGAFAVAASRDGSVRVWDLKTASPSWTIDGHGSAALSADFLPHGGVAASFSDGTVSAWDAQGAPLWSVRIAAEELYRLRVSPDGRRIAVGGVALHILDAETGTPLLRLRPHADTLWSLGWSHDGSTLATASWDGTVGWNCGRARR
jgi:WD40 repeat protein